MHSHIHVLIGVCRVVENEAKNKMSLSNITKLLGPTLMTVDGDPVSIALLAVIPSPPSPLPLAAASHALA